MFLIREAVPVDNSFRKIRRLKIVLLSMWNFSLELLATSCVVITGDDEPRVWTIFSVPVYPCQCLMISQSEDVTITDNWIQGIKVWRLTNRMWFSVVCTLIDNDTRHHSVQKLLWTHASWAHDVLTTVTTRIVVDNSTAHAKPRQSNKNVQRKCFFFSERKLRKALRDASSVV